jgi:hypothetical protein
MPIDGQGAAEDMKRPLTLAHIQYCVTWVLPVVGRQARIANWSEEPFREAMFE